MATHARKDRCILRRFLRSVACLVAGAALACLPVVAAQAAFTASATARGTVSTRLLESPDPAQTSVTASCTGKNKKHQMDISVDKFGLVPGANYYSLTVLDPSGVIRQSADLTTTSGSSYSDAGAITGVWTYEIRGDYRVPSSTNAWKGDPLRGTVTCY